MRRYEFEQYAAVRRHQGLSFSPNGQEVAYTNNVSGQFNVWRQATHLGPDATPAAPVQLTALDEDVARTVAWSPDGADILTTVDHQGNENFQLCRIPARAGWLYPITKDFEARYEVPGKPFSPEGRRLLYGSNARNPADFDALIRDLETVETRSLMAGGANYFPASWSPDGTKVLIVELHGNTNTDLHVHDLRDGTSTNITPHDGEAIFGPGPWIRNGDAILVLSNKDREFLGLGEVALNDGALTWIETPEWDVQDVERSRDGRYLAWIVNENGYSRLYVQETATGTRLEFADLPAGVYTSLEFSPTEPILGLYISRATAPNDLYMLDVETGKHWRLTRSFLGGVPEKDMVEPEPISYESFDGKKIPAYLYRPQAAEPGTRVPVVLSIHGGPEAQELPTYLYYGLYQYLLDLGIGVLATNIRGSTGYGISYQKLIHRDFGGDELKDLEHAALYLRTLDWVNPDKLGVFGGSFGGFATLSCLTRLPQYWAAGVDIVGPSNLITFARAVPEFWKRFMKEWVGDPDEDADMLRERSPITYVDNIRAPVLIMQGANDPRVVQAESDQMVERLRQLGRTVEYMVFEDEGHGFVKIPNVLKAYRATTGWFEKYLLD